MADHVAVAVYAGSEHRLSAALAYQTVGLREELDGRWLVSFAQLDIGHVDHTGFARL